MARIKDNKKPKRNPTEERLRATSFATADELDAEEKSIRLDTWRRMTAMRVFDELSTKPEMNAVVEELKAGLTCGLQGGSKDHVYRVFSDGPGLKLEINKRFAESLGEHQVRFFQGAVQAGIEGYGALVYRAKGLIKKPSSEPDGLDEAARAGFGFQSK